MLLALVLMAGVPVLAPTWMPVATPAWAVRPDEVLADPRLEARARALSKELRCMVCQNQSIDDSEAPLARDLRILVRERLVAGDSDQQVLDFLVARYGEFVLLKPRLSWHTALLWLGPPALLFGGGVVLVLFARRRPRPARPDLGLDAEPLTPAEETRLAELTRPQ
jgi:cytochrome c-type biogenesis protein CcmH